MKTPGPDLLEEQADRSGWMWSLALGGAFGALAMTYSLVLWRYQVQWEHGIHRDWWYQAGDVWMIVDAGRFVWHGALGYVYQGAGQSYALPVSYILMAPVSAIVDHFGLAEGIIPLPRAAAWPVVAVFILLFNVFVLDGVRRLAWDLGARRRLWALQVAVVVVVCVPAFQFGHFEDVLALTFLLHATRYLLASRPLMCCLLLSLAISCKQWAVLALPLVIVLAPRGRRPIASAVALALPALLAGIVVLTDPRHGVAALFSPASPRRTDPGHVSFFFSWFGSKTSRATRTASVLLSPVLAYLLRSVRRPPAVLGALSALLIIRPLVEPIGYSYYWMPPFVMAGMAGVAAFGRFRIRDWIWQVGAVVWALPHSNPKTNGMWWAVEAVLLVGAALQLAMNCGLLPSSWLRRSVRATTHEVRPMAVSEPVREDTPPSLSAGGR